VSIGQGTRLGQYEVQDFIGQGAMGLVYRAYHAQLERTGAIKVMQAISPDQDTVARFRHEAQAIAKLRHPNIVDVYDFGEFQGTPYMIVEYIPGGSLATRMEHGPLDKATALRYLRGIAAGLDYAHNHGIVHRDVKPANVLMTNEDTPVLADFGLAKLLQGSSLKSMTGVTTGTPAYMAPEQVTGHQVGPAADRYSLATIAYEMLTGYIPFDGEALMELLYAQVHRLPPPASSRSADLSPEVDAVLLKGLAKDPKDRWESATAFVEALDAALAAPPARVLAETVIMASPVISTRRLATTVASPPELDQFVDAETTVAYPSPPPPAAAPKRSRRRLAIGLAALLVLLLLLGVCAVASQATTLAVDPQRTLPGGRVTVTATHVPASQVGEIQLLSSLYAYTFRSNSGGEVSQEIVVPADIELGNHIVRICWDRSCHKQTPLRVVSGVALAEPTPAANASASPSASPSGGVSPNPSSTPTPAPAPISTPRSTATPTSTPKTSPKPTPSPSPSPTPIRYVTVDKISTLNGFQAVLHNFGGGTWAISLVNVTLGTTTAKGSVVVPPGNTYYTTPTYNSTGVVVSNSARVKACNGSTCYVSNLVSVTLN
jgi:serine/threonine-protein kinase